VVRRARWQFWRRRRSDADFADEIASHLELEADQLAREGMPPADARAGARRAFGNVAAWKERFHDAQRILLVDNVIRDLRYAWRGLRRSPAFAIVVALTLAIGIGANAAVISIIDTVFLRKLPVPAPERVIGIFSGDVHNAARRPVVGWNSFPDYLDLRTRLQGVEGLAAYSMWWLPLGDSLSGTSVWSALVSGNYFSVLGIHAARGRVIMPDEEEPRGAHPVVVISDALWRSRFAGDAHIVGQHLAIGAGLFTIIGVAPPGFTGTHPEGRTDAWIPYTMYAEASGKNYIFDNRDGRFTAVIGRLAPGATLVQVQASLDRASHDLAVTYPEVDGLLRMRAGSHEQLFPFEQNPSVLLDFLLVLAMVALLHLVACGNIASLMLARAAARRQELGIRLCLGASRGRVILQSLAEPALLAVMGAVGGVVIARWLTLLITSMQFLSAMDAGLDIRVLVIVGLVTVATVLEFGLVPALEASRRDPLSMIRGSSGARVARRKDRAGAFLVAAQVAVSLIFLANAATLLRTFQRQAAGDPGYDSSHLLVATVAPRNGSALTRDWAARIDEMTRRVASLPGVSHVAVSSGAPLLPGGWFEEVVVGGHQYAVGESRSMSGQNIGPGYFATIGTAMVRGREFTSTDRAAGAANVQGFDGVVVNEAMARRFWPGEDPIGKQVAYRNRGSATVVGVVRDIHDVTPSQVVPRAYFPLFELPVIPRFELVVRSTGDPVAIRSTLRAVITSWSLPVESPPIQTMDEILAGALFISRAASIGLGTCAAVALLLTAVGLYGLVASWSAERRGEIGIRLALGARAWQVHRLLVGGVVRLTVAGAVVGLAGAIVMVRFERSLYGPSIAFEAWPLVIAMFVLSAAAAMAAYIPSRRATRIDPARSLRAE
jgi:predicted permease